MKQRKKLSSCLLLVAILTTVSINLNAQNWKTEKRINVLFGLAQPVLASGFNVEADYIHHRFIFDYSHGASLDYSGSLLTKDLKRQGLAVHEPWTTGFGIGYRAKEWINLRAEPKWHRFEFYYDGEPQTKGTEITSYNTFSLGLGVYGSYRPFKTKANFLKGLLIAPSLRYWPTVSSGLKDDKFIYQNKRTKSAEAIKTLDPGTGFTPFVFNVSVGYSFQFKKRE